MKFRLPSPVSVIIGVVAAALALWSLPPASNGYSGTHQHHQARQHHRLPIPASGFSARVRSVMAAQPGSLPTDNQTTAPRLTPYVPWPNARLRIHVIDGRTQQPIRGAEVVLIETEQRLTTRTDGYTEWFDAPVVRNPRYRPMVAELHGQLGVIVYRNGYRDAIHLGIRLHEGIPAESTVWMYQLGPGDRRIEPVLYQVPYHHIWLVELADKFRSNSQPGEGPERP